MIEWLQGYKTYIVFVLGVIFNLGVLVGWWAVDSEIWTLINSILAFLGLGTIGAKINRVAKK